jgi:hypothetical protein
MIEDTRAIAHSWARRGGSDSFAAGGDDASPNNSGTHAPGGLCVRNGTEGEENT